MRPRRLITLVPMSLTLLVAGAAAASAASGGNPGGASPGGASPGAGTTTAVTTTPAQTTPVTTPTTTTAAPPLHLHSAKLAVSGTALVFTLATARGWSPASLLLHRRSLCVRIVYQAGGFQSRDVCVNRKGPGMTIARVLRSGAHGPLHELAGATMTQPTAKSLRVGLAPAKIGIPAGATIRWRGLSTTDGCVIGGNSGCYEALPAGGAELTLTPPAPVGCTAAGPAYVVNGARGKRVVALTFDDGPSTYTSRFLDVLEREKVTATFFMIGQQVSGFAGQLRRELRDGFMLADHTWSHPNVSGGGSFAAGQISSTANAIQKATGFRPCLFRAPYGAVSSSLFGTARGLGFTTIEWDVDPQDWARPGTDAIYSRVMSQVRPGSIILMHEGGGPREQTLAALPRIIHALKARGYGFVTVAEMTGAKLRYR